MFSDNLRALRKARGLSQEELAQRLHITRQTISKWENALSVPDAELLIRLSEVFEVPVSDLLGGYVESPDQPGGVAAQLEQLNHLLAERNRRSRRIWRIVAGVCIGFILFYLLLLVLSFASFSYFTTEPAVDVTALPERTLCPSIPAMPEG